MLCLILLPFLSNLAKPFIPVSPQLVSLCTFPVLQSKKGRRGSGPSFLFLFTKKVH